MAAYAFNRWCSHPKKVPAANAQTARTMSASMKPMTEKAAGFNRAVKASPWNRLFMKSMNSPGAATHASVHRGVEQCHGDSECKSSARWAGHR